MSSLSLHLAQLLIWSVSFRRDGRVPLEDVTPKVLRIIEEDEVMAKTTGEAVKMNLAGRNFSCCIHSDLPRECEIHVV